jgi:hypothetical protein
MQLPFIHVFALFFIFGLARSTIGVIFFLKIEGLWISATNETVLGSS